MEETDVTERRKRLSARQQALLDERIRGVRGSANPVLRKQRLTRCRASHAQERIWLLDQLGLVGPAYTMPFAAGLEGHLDVAALERTFDEIVRRHEVLRTRFELEDGVAVQVVEAPGPFRLGRVDISALQEAGRKVEIRRQMEEEISRPFDLSRGPLFRAMLIHVSEAKYVVVVTMHHIVSDGWSIRVLMREVGELYASFRQDRPSPLAELPIQYADYATWQRAWLGGESINQQVAYWKDRLAGAPPALNLATDRARPAVASFAGDAVELALPTDLSTKLVELGRQEGTTSYMVFLAAYQLLLQRYSGQDDILVGSPIAGRARPELAGLIGFFVNTLVMRTDLSGDPSFRELLGRVRQTARGAYAHQDLPFERLVEELHPVRDLSRQSIFQAAFVMENFPDERLTLPELNVWRINNARRTAKCDLSLYVYERGGLHEACFEYTVDLFDRASIERLSRHWLLLLERAVSQPDTPLSAVSMLSDEERAERQYVELSSGSLGSDHAMQIVQSGSLVDCFLAQVRSRSDQPAIISTATTWSYRELNREAGRIAALLARWRGEDSEPIGLLFPHEPAMIAAMLGVLGARKFYVPLSPLDPTARLQTILAESGCRHVLASPKLRILAEQLGADLQFSDEAPAEPVELCVRSQAAIAYVLYTSGTTGVPKGVAQCDRGVLQHMATYSAALDIGSEDRITLFARYGTDAAVKNVFGALLNGAALSLWDIREDGTDGLLPWLVESGVTIWHSTPGFLRAAMPQFAESADLRWVVLGGEAARPGDIEIVRRHGGAHCRLLTALSQTECSTGTHYAPDLERDVQRARLPVGRAVPGAEIILLDDVGQPADLRGEVAIGGRGIALGYWKRPDLTAQRFVPHPYRDGERLYRTGDLARWRHGGELEHLGRLDHQVKIRGYSVAPMEIEVALLALGDVAQAAVVVREDVPSDPRLAAYVVGRKGATIDAGMIRGALKQRLPDYMIPSAFVVLDDLPLTASRKVDRNALPAPAFDDIVRSRYEAPRTPTEEMLVAVFADILKTGRVGVHDNFFELGGHSLMATRVMSRLRDAFAIAMPLRAIFENPTIAELADWIDTLRWAAQGDASGGDVIGSDELEQGVL